MREKPDENEDGKEVLGQCRMVNCRKVQLLRMLGWPSELHCRWCGGPIEVLTVDGEPCTS